MKRDAILVVLALVVTAALGLSACAPDEGGAEPVGETAAAVDPAYQAEIEEWRAQREERLRAEDGWLTLAGLHWLPEGESSVGSEPMMDVVLPASAPARVGTLRREGERVWFAPAPGVEATHGGEGFDELELTSDDEGAPPATVELGTLSFHAIARGERLGLRVRDSAAPTRTAFTGMESFPIDPGWRVEARFEPYEPAREIQIDDYSGGTQDGVVPGAVVFEVGGESLRLDAMDAGDELFLIFADRTSGESTYGGGRYLYAAKPGDDGRVIVDFNKAYNPPCVFTPYATCPLPPRQNRLAVAIEAGEKAYEGTH